MTEVYYFGSDWCTVCLHKRPLVEQLCREHGVRYTYLDVDEAANKQSAEAFGFKTIPAAVVVRWKPEEPGATQAIVYRAAGRLINARALVAAFGRANGQG